ncbi:MULTISPECIES: PfkB family carbohydrate kinase [Roseovarius]|uniref:PfkB family carbohydrate kinase n=1 Tax=Roseovarius TaxID=74030 RepID=UPI001C95626A|nr:PfkB family carbohydrate kinase [Roseovarius atlanticus]MBY5988765.1 kinase [Roseovarius atlanticus]MBY6124156.1 kinase [Roseovarius atlanticus]MBY6148651.1 kinase [Roseovarius atlanticus]
MTRLPDILCIGSVLWDIIGRAPSAMRPGADVPGRITRGPGGVALNIALSLAHFGLRPALLSAVGRDAPGEELLALCAARGLDTSHVWRASELPTDQYMAIEGAGGLVAAIADAHSLEAAGDRILAPLHDGTLGSAAHPHSGPVALDGNLTTTMLTQIAHDPAFSAADLRIAPASPGKAERLLPFLQTGRGILYVNLEEAGILCGRAFATAPEAAEALIARGAARAIVTNGAAPAADAGPDGVLTGQPPPVLVTRVTGAGDTFMAAHIAAECTGASRATALDRALQAAATHVSSEIAP